MTSPLFDVSELLKLEGDLGRVAPQALLNVRVATQASALALKNAWAANAAATSGIHGKHYPSSITYETDVSTAGVRGQVGPDSSKPQGGMGRGFEYGSVNQPPHMDGTKAADVEEPRFVAAVTKAIESAMSTL